MKKLYDKICSVFSLSKVSAFITILFLLSLLPIIYLGLHNYPTGDDFWYGVYTNRAWAETGSLIEALKGSFRMVKEMYVEWQGTWFTLFLFTLSPSIFVKHGYYIVIFISLGLLIGGTGYLTYYYIVRKLAFPRAAWLILLCTVLYPAIQYIPRTTSGLFWFNGIMHYSVPYMLACIAVVQTQKFMEGGKSRNFLSLFLCFTLLGGGSYLMPIAASLVAMLIFLAYIQITRSSTGKLQICIPRRNWLLLIAFAAELIGLLISFLAPGNSVRGGETFGADPKWALQCIWYAIDRGIYLGIDYFQENPVNLLIYIGLAVFLWNIMWNISQKTIFRLPAIFVLYTNGIYWAIYTPEIYARSDVSGGVPNTYFHVFLLVTLANIIYVHGWIQNQILKCWNRKAIQAKASIPNTIMIPVMALIMLLLIFTSHTFERPTTNDYCLEYIKSGKMEEYVRIREEQYTIMTNETILDAVIPEVGDQYPLLHMYLSEDDPTSQHNVNQANFYGKNSVIAHRID